MAVSVGRSRALLTHVRLLQSSAKGFVSVILEKYKDPKTSIGTAVTECLSCIHKYCLPLSELADDLMEALNHKNPKIKVDTAKLLQVGAHSLAFSSPAFVNPPVPTYCFSCSSSLRQWQCAGLCGQLKQGRHSQGALCAAACGHQGRKRPSARRSRGEHGGAGVFCLEGEQQHGIAGQGPFSGSPSGLSEHMVCKLWRNAYLTVKHIVYIWRSFGCCSSLTIEHCQVSGDFEESRKKRLLELAQLRIGGGDSKAAAVTALNTARSSMSQSPAAAPVATRVSLLRCMGHSLDRHAAQLSSTLSSTVPKVPPTSSCLFWSRHK